MLAYFTIANALERVHVLKELLKAYLGEPAMSSKWYVRVGLPL